MTPDKRAQITAFVENSGMSDAVYAVLKEQITPEGFKAFASKLDRSNITAFGAQIAARLDAIEILENGFAQLAVIAKQKGGVQSKENKNSTR